MHAPSISAASNAPSLLSSHNNNIVPNESTKQLPYVASNVDDFINNNTQLQTPHERKVSSSDEDYEPYTRRDFRIDVKPTDRTTNDTSSGYFTSPTENEKLPSVSKSLNVLSPDEDDDLEKNEYHKSIVKSRDEYSSSPADSQSGRSISSHRKSVSFDLEVEEYTPDYTPIDDPLIDPRLPKDDDEDVFYGKSRYHHQQLQPEPKRIKGILRSPSPSVYYKGNVSSRVSLEEEYIEDDGDDEISKENPFRKAYLSQERLEVSSDGLPAQTTEDFKSARRSFENLQVQAHSKIPIKKTIFKSTGSLVDRPKIPPPRPPQPNVKVAEVVKNKGLYNMRDQMEEEDFMEFVHNAETNTIEEVKGHELFDPDDPLPPLPKCPPPPLNFKRANSFDRPKVSPPPPPAPKSPKFCEEILEILPATFDKFPIKQKPHYVNENSQSNILVTEEEHREILLTENELRNAMLTEYEEKTSNLGNIFNSTSTNPFLDDAASSSFDSSSFQSTPNVLSPVSTLDKSGSSSFGQYIPTYQSSQHVQSINILPPPAQVLPVHYGQLPKPQQAGYYPLVPHQYPVLYNEPSTGFVTNTHPQTYIQQQSVSDSSPYVLGQRHQQQQAFLVSGDGQNNFYVTHNVNNPTANNQQHHPTLLMQSAYGPSPSNQTSLQQSQMQVQTSHSQYFASTPPNNNRPQFIYEHQHQKQQEQLQQQFNQNSLRNNNIQYSQQQQHSELSPIRVNQLPQNFMYPPNSPGEQKQMSTFGKQTEV